jgi:hypothetical protein
VRLELGSILLRNSSVLRPLLIAVACGLLAARSTLLVRAAFIVLVLAILPLQLYPRIVERLSRERRPLRAASDCLARVASALPGAGQPAHAVYAVFPESLFWHPYFYYLRHVGPWQSVEQQPPDALLRAWLHDSAAQRVMLLADEWYQDYRRRVSEPQSPPMISFGNVLLVMPGPYAVCSPEGRAG